MTIQATPIPAFADNYLWLLSRDGGEQVAVVDPGDATPVLAALEQRGVSLGAVLITHHHADHIGGVDELLRRFPKAPVYAPADERIGGVTHRVNEGQRVHVECLDCVFEVLEVPGHTATHVAYYGNQKLFCGDTLFACGCGRLFEGTPGQMHRSLSKLMNLPDDTAIYCAHEYTLANIAFAMRVEPHNAELARRQHDARRLRERDAPTVPSLLVLEKRTNPFLRFDQPSVIVAAERRAGCPLRGGADVFAVVRRWKDEA